MKSKEWTLMFYFASDNPLASTIVSQLKAIKDAGYHPDANVIAHFDPHDPSTPTHVFDINHVSKFWNPNQSEVGFGDNNPFVRDLVMDRLWGESNPGIRKAVIVHVGKPAWTPPGTTYDPPQPKAEMDGEQDPDKALESFLKFCRESYPARHYMLFIMGHGQVVGNDNLLFDDHAEKKALTLTKLGELLRSLNGDVENDSEPGQVELITLHSCSMIAMEVAYELKGAANYLLASQGPTYVGNLPYKQILIRVFNDLNAGIGPDDVNGNHGKLDGKQSLIAKLSKTTEKVAEFVSGNSALSPSVRRALETFNPETKPEDGLVSDILKAINGLLESEGTDRALQSLIPLNGASNGTKNGKGNRRRINRLRLAQAFPEISRIPKLDIETMVSKIFYYSLYNSYDFQLAGYPYDLCLTNLNKVPETEEPINQLAGSLIKALKEENPIAKQLILLAHWDAQSFYQEEYVDLYDFCFSLKKRCNEFTAGLKAIPEAVGLENIAPFPMLAEIVNACEKMIDVLEKGSGKLTTLAAFAGAAFQYSHGHSIYFPWTRPTDFMWEEQYDEYRLNEKTNWREFLDVYFTQTRRQTRAEELGDKGKPKAPEKMGDPADRENLLELMGQIGAHVFAGDGSLSKSKPGPDSPMGRRGPDDPFGAGDCNCPSIKNYPPFTSTVGKEVPFHASEDFLEGQPLMVSDSNGS